MQRRCHSHIPEIKGPFPANIHRVNIAALATEYKLDYALLPIGDNYTMGPQDALEAVGMLKPKAVIPMHYNSNPLIKQSPDDFKQAVEKRYGIKTIVMQPGQAAGTIAL